VVSLAVGRLSGKLTFIASASNKAVESGFNAGKHFGILLRELGGRGGGKASFARGGLPDSVSYSDLVDKARKVIKQTQG
jgi:alanyl-tRNA synthetase